MCQRIGVAAIGEGATHIAFRKPRERDQSGGGFRIEPASIEQGYAAILTLQPGARDQVGDILVAAWILAEQRQPVGRLAFAGAQQDDAYFVRCDRTTMTQDDIDNGRLVVLVGFAPVQPAEFVTVRIA